MRQSMTLLRDLFCDGHQYTSYVFLASSPGLRGVGERTTECACARVSVYFTVKIPVKLKVNHGHGHERRSCTEEVPGEPRTCSRRTRTLSHTACMIWTMNIELVQCGVIMATIKVNVCKFCGSTVLPKRSVVLFSKEGIKKDLPGRVSRVVDLPVSREDDLSPHSCIPCMRLLRLSDPWPGVAMRSRKLVGHSRSELGYLLHINTKYPKPRPLQVDTRPSLSSPSKAWGRS